MDKYTAILPSLVLVMAGVLLCVAPSYGAVATLMVASALWGFHFYITRPMPVPPRTDEPRLALIEHDIKEAMKQIDSVKTAVNMRQLR